MLENLYSEECELIGALIGDGHIRSKNCQYIVGFTGNQKLDVLYFEKLQAMIKQVWNKDVRLFFRSHAVRIQFNSKTIVMRLIHELGLPFNSGKCYVVKISEIIASNWDLTKHTIRGITDTDGSNFVANKPGSPNYPSIEITTTSIALANQ